MEIYLGNVQKHVENSSISNLDSCPSSAIRLGSWVTSAWGIYLMRAKTT